MVYPSVCISVLCFSLVMKKNDGGMRLFMEFWNLTSMVIRADTFIDDLSNQLQGEVFSMIDL